MAAVLPTTVVASVSLVNNVPAAQPTVSSSSYKLPNGSDFKIKIILGRFQTALETINKSNEATQKLFKPSLETTIRLVAGFDQLQPTTVIKMARDVCFAHYAFTSCAGERLPYKVERDIKNYEEMVLRKRDLLKSISNFDDNVDGFENADQSKEVMEKTVNFISYYSQYADDVSKKV